MDIDITTAVTVCGALASGGAAWGGALMALNGSRKKIHKLAGDFEKHVTNDASFQTDVTAQLASIKTTAELRGETIKGIDSKLDRLVDKMLQDNIDGK